MQQERADLPESHSTKTSSAVDIECNDFNPVRFKACEVDIFSDHLHQEEKKE